MIIKLPKDFEIISNKDDMIEFKSKIHYWKMVKSSHDNAIILAHKYKKSDTYHKQCVFYNNITAVKYVIAHDKFVLSKNI